MKKILIAVLAFASATLVQANELSSIVYLKTAGNSAKAYPLEWQEKSKNNWQLIAKGLNSLVISVSKKSDNYSFIINSKADVNFNLQNFYSTKFSYPNSEFLLPGLWYKKNLRSSEGAPSTKVASNWSVREDRLSSPLSGAFDNQKQQFVTVLRQDDIVTDSLGVPAYGEVLLNSDTDLGSVGFGKGLAENKQQVYLQFGYPAQEAPNSYVRKLTLAPKTMSFVTLPKGDKRQLNYQIKTGKAEDFAAFVEQTWRYSFDALKPQVVKNALPTKEVKQLLVKFYQQSYINESELAGFSGAHIHTALAEKKQILEIGFIGRVLLNAFNALEYGEQNQNQGLVKIGQSVFNSYLKSGFKESGFFREYVNFENNYEDDVISIRRQSEGIYAVLHYLAYEEKQGRTHPQWQKKIRQLLTNMSKLQRIDGSFPRKFDSNFKILDASGGSSSSVVLPLVMAHKYFNDNSYLDSARATAKYLENTIIKNSDYFSSTLDANCEDKEASFYTATALYYLAQVTTGKEQRHYTELAAKTNYFVLSWYYNWDVPFAKGQMLGDVGFKTRGWGNVSVENNHVDVFIFGYLDVLRWLAKEQNEPRFTAFAKVIESSMKSQLLPRKGHMFNIAKEGYQPEVVQHTNWDYGHFGKGFYNDTFAPGWTVASLWEMLSPGRAKDFLAR
ncbi:MAG: hypothetical protein OCD00_07460 [Colwellia sp.]